MANNRTSFLSRIRGAGVALATLLATVPAHAGQNGQSDQAPHKGASQAKMVPADNGSIDIVPPALQKNAIVYGHDETGKIFGVAPQGKSAVIIDGEGKPYAPKGVAVLEQTNQEYMTAHDYSPTAQEHVRAYLGRQEIATKDDGEVAGVLHHQNLQYGLDHFKNLDQHGEMKGPVKSREGNNYNVELGKGVGDHRNFYVHDDHGNNYIVSDKNENGGECTCVSGTHGGKPYTGEFHHDHHGKWHLDIHSHEHFSHVEIKIIVSAITQVTAAASSFLASSPNMAYFIEDDFPASSVSVNGYPLVKPVSVAVAADAPKPPVDRTKDTTGRSSGQRVTRTARAIVGKCASCCAKLLEQGREALDEARETNRLLRILLTAMGIDVSKDKAGTGIIKGAPPGGVTPPPTAAQRESYKVSPEDHSLTNINQVALLPLNVYIPDIVASEVGMIGRQMYVLADQQVAQTTVAAPAVIAQINQEWTEARRAYREYNRADPTQRDAMAIRTGFALAAMENTLPALMKTDAAKAFTVIRYLVNKSQVENNVFRVRNRDALLAWVRTHNHDIGASGGQKSARQAKNFVANYEKKAARAYRPNRSAAQQLTA